MRNLKKHLALDRGRPRHKAACCFSNWHSRNKYFQKLSNKISHIDARFYASDHCYAYNLIDPAKHLTGKAHTYTIERMNRLMRYYLARFARKTYCYSKSLQMIKYSLLLFMHRDFVEHMKI